MARTVKSRTDKSDPAVAEPVIAAEAEPIIEVTIDDSAPRAVLEPKHTPGAVNIADPISEPDPTLAPNQSRPLADANKPAGIGPMVLGGVVAAALGYAAAYWGQNRQSAEVTALLTSQTEKIDALESQLSALPISPDLTPISTSLAELQANLSTTQASTNTALAAFETRLEQIERTPNADGTLADTAIAAWERELANLRTEFEGQQARMQDIADAATAQLDQTRVEAASIEQTATQANAAANARAALARVQAALDSGTAFDSALGELAANVAIPELLTELSAEGIPTMTVLQADFPDAARAALAVARTEGLSGEDGGGIAGFLRNQFDVRSVTPQEGTTADAVLSRAEEDLRQNRLSDAMAEIATLPEVVRAEMSGWTGAAQARIAAIAAVEALSQSLTSN